MWYYNYFRKGGYVFNITIISNFYLHYDGLINSLFYANWYFLLNSFNFYDDWVEPIRPCDPCFFISQTFGAEEDFLNS